MKIYYVKLLAITLLIGLIQFSCKSSAQNIGLPSCIDSKIEVLKKEPVANPPAEVWKWESNGKIFYYYNAACCDQFSILYNESCDIICAPDGGFTGRGDGKCPEFSKDSKRTLIWKDTRK